MSKNPPIQHQEQDTQDHARIVCIICGALYAPAQAQRTLVDAPPIALESAFLSMCHFCFRCRRPSCPQCWDSVHGICGACVEEAGLTFRIPATPLSSQLFTPIRQQQLEHEQAAPAPLVCIQPGRFAHTNTIETVDTRPDLPVISTPPAGLPILPHPPEDQSFNYHVDLPKESVPFSPALPLKVSVVRQSPNQRIMEAEKRLQPIIERREGGRVSTILLALTTLVLAILIGLLVATSLSPEINKYLADTLHVDIQAGIDEMLRWLRINP